MGGEPGMRFLFIHANFPAQHGPFALTLAQSGHQVVYLTAQEKGELEGVSKVVYRPRRQAGEKTHHYVRAFENEVLHGQAALEAMLALKQQGFLPDVVFGHAGWGATLFIREAFPRALVVHSFEWFYRAIGSDLDFDPSDQRTLDFIAGTRPRNASVLLDLVSADAGLCATEWQRRQFPAEFHRKLDVMHEGVDVEYHLPARGTPLRIDRLGLALPAGTPLITYVSRGLEPYRGFPQFIEAIHLIQQRHPAVHTAIVGADRVFYGDRLPEGESWKQRMLAKFPLDPARTHFTGQLDSEEYRNVLRASSVHVYLTRPYILSWSALEAMSAGCLVVASDTEPVREVMQDGFNALLVDFFSPSQIAERVLEGLTRPERFEGIRAKARETILHRYSRQELVPRRFTWVAELLDRPRRD